MSRSKLTTKEFIERAKKVHGDKYIYTATDYIDSVTKVCIICPEHGEFWQQPNTHLKGSGCPICNARGNKQRLTKEEFIRRAREIHGNKYDYTKVEYKNSIEKVCVICPEHGEFWIKPDFHLRGGKCPKCRVGKTSPYTQEDFINMAREKHGNKYDYSKVLYKNMNIPVCIICPEHGEFWQKPWIHLSKRGCPKCAKKAAGEDFIRKAREIHGDKYDYSKVVYKNMQTKVCIIDKEL